MYKQSTFGTHVLHFEGSAKEREAKRLFFQRYQTDPDKPENEKGFREFYIWLIGDSKYKKLMG